MFEFRQFLHDGIAVSVLDTHQCLDCALIQQHFVTPRFLVAQCLRNGVVGKEHDLRWRLKLLVLQVVSDQRICNFFQPCIDHLRFNHLHSDVRHQAKKAGQDDCQKYESARNALFQRAVSLHRQPPVDSPCQAG